jgi:imidazolonepropionase-like amidohydrolase
VFAMIKSILSTSAWRIAAKLLDLSDEVGTIASGKSADVIAVDSSPVDDVSVLQRVAFVMAPGDVYLGAT